MSRKINEATVEEWKGLLEACDSRTKDMNLVHAASDRQISEFKEIPRLIA